MTSSLRLKNRLKHYRTQRGMTQEVLAQQASVSRKTINVIEAGDYSPSVALALTIAAILDQPLEDIFFLA